MDGYIVAQTVMMTLGGFQFGISTAAYQELTRVCEYRWPSQDRFGQMPVSQFTGKGQESISLPGVIFPEWRGGFGQLNAMRALAETGQPQTLVDGSGNVLGLWAIESVEEKQTVFAAQGLPRRMEFSLRLKRVPDDLGGFGLASVASGIASTVAVAATGSPTAAAQVSALAGGSVNSSAQLTTRLNSALLGVQSQVGQIGSGAQSVISALRRSTDAVSGLRRGGGDALATLGRATSSAAALSAASGLFENGTRLLINATSSSSAIAAVDSTMSPIINGQPAVAAVREALLTANRVTSTLSSVTSQSGRIIRALQ